MEVRNGKQMLTMLDKSKHAISKKHPGFKKRKRPALRHHLVEPRPLRKRRDWTILSNGCGGWLAWNAKDKTKQPLIDVGSFADAVKVFDAQIGPYYVSRSTT